MNVEKVDVINVHGLRTGSTKNVKLAKTKQIFLVQYCNQETHNLA